jgi:hypothetical protein
MYSPFYHAKHQTNALVKTTASNTFGPTQYFTSINGCIDFESKREYSQSTQTIIAPCGSYKFRRNSTTAFYLSDKTLYLVDLVSQKQTTLNIAVTADITDYTVTETQAYLYLEDPACVVVMSLADYSYSTAKLTLVPVDTRTITAVDSCPGGQGPGFYLTSLYGLYLYDVKGTFVATGGTYLSGMGNFLLVGSTVWTAVSIGSNALCYCPLFNPAGEDPMDGYATNGHTIMLEGMASLDLCQYDATHIVVAAQDSYLLFDTEAHSFTSQPLEDFGVPKFFTPYDHDTVLAYNNVSTTGIPLERIPIKALSSAKEALFYETIQTVFITTPHYGFVSGVPNAFTTPQNLTSASFKDTPTGESSAHFTSIECPSLMRKVELMIVEATK